MFGRCREDEDGWDAWDEKITGHSDYDPDDMPTQEEVVPPKLKLTPSSRVNKTNQRLAKNKTPGAHGWPGVGELCCRELERVAVEVLAFHVVGGFLDVGRLHVWAVPFHLTVFATCSAIQPSRMISVRYAALSKFEYAARPPFIMSNHSWL